MKTIKVLYSKHFFGRDMFILEIDNKVLEVYRSSGLSGTGHGGDFLPYAGINDRHTLSTQLGYIYKEMLYEGRWLNHRKQLHFYPEVEELMKDIKEQLEGIHPEKHKDFETIEELKDYIQTINSERHKVLKDREFLDLGKDI